MARNRPFAFDLWRKPLTLMSQWTKLPRSELEYGNETVKATLEWIQGDNLADVASTRCRRRSSGSLGRGGSFRGASKRGQPPIPTASEGNEVIEETKKMEAQGRRRVGHGFIIVLLSFANLRLQIIPVA